MSTSTDFETWTIDREIDDIIDLSETIAAHPGMAVDGGTRHRHRKAALIAMGWRHHHHEERYHPESSSDVYQHVRLGQSQYIRLWSDDGGLEPLPANAEWPTD